MMDARISWRKKAIAWFLAVSLVVTLTPELAFAAPKETQAKQAALGGTEEAVIDKGETVTTYDLGGGKRKSVFHGGKVRFTDENGKLSDYDPSFIEITGGEMTRWNGSLQDYAYRNSQGDKKHYMPQILSESTPVILENGPYEIRLSPDSKTIDNAGIGSASAQVGMDKIVTLHGEEKDAQVRVTYGNGQSSAGFMYTSGENGLKESIAFNEAPKSNVITYKLNTGGLKARENTSNGGITFYDGETEEPIASVVPPWVRDAANITCTKAAAYELKEEGQDTGKYTLSIAIDGEYLADEARQYPVMIDTAIAWQVQGQISGTPVLGGDAASVNLSGEGDAVMPAGENENGRYETYIEFENLKSIVAGKKVKSAELVLHETGSSTGGQSLGLFEVTDSWDAEDITYRDRPAHAANAVASASSTPKDGTAFRFDLLPYVNAIAEDGADDYGLVLKNTSATPDGVAFYTGNSVSVSSQPEFIIIYSEDRQDAALAGQQAEVSQEKADVDSEPSGKQMKATAARAAGSTDTTAPAVKSMAFKDAAGIVINGKATGETNPVIEFSEITDDNIGASCITYALMAGSAQPASADYKNPAELSISGTQPYSGSFRLTAADRTLATGEYTLYVRVRDNAGNETVKTFRYLKDIDDPLGSIIITDLVTGNEIDQIYQPVNVEVGVSGTGSSITESSLKLYKAQTNASGQVTGVVAGTEKTLRKNFTISENIVMDTTDVCDSYGPYRLVLFLKDEVGRTKEITSDFEVVYTLPAPYEAAVAHSTGGTSTLTWGFNYTPQQKIKLASIEGYFGNEEIFSQMVAPGEDGTLPFAGTSAITVPDEEGIWDVTLRGVAKDGHAGMEVVVPCVIDKTAPVVSLTNFNQGYLIGSITDDNVKEWRIYAKEKTAAAYGDVPLARGDYAVDNYLIAFLDLSKSPFEAGKEYTLKVVAEDKAGNAAEGTIDIAVPTDGTIARLVEPQLEIEKGARNPAHGGFIVGTSQQTLTLKNNVQGASWYINNMLTAPSLALDVPEEEAFVYKDFWNDVLAIKKEADGTRKYSAYTIENGLKEAITFTTGEIKGNVGTKSVDLDESMVAFTIKAQPGVASYQIQTYAPADTGYITVQPDTKYYITDITEGSAFASGFNIKATAASGKNVNDAKIVMYFDTLVNESFLLTDVEDYAPANLRAENKINHKTYLKWDIPETLPDKISYEVYRSTAEDFEPDESNLIASDVKAGYYTEVDAVHGKTYYYKVRAVESYYDEWGLLVENYSTFSEVRSARTVDLNESLKHLGMKEFWEFTQFNTPNGNGYVEKSAGNFLYQQKDAELPNEGFDVNLTRAYNSQASTQGTFGFGWSHEYDIELLNISEDNSLAFTHVILKDGNGTIYHFTRDAGDRYFISSLGSYVNLTAENEEKTKTVTISGAESSTVELKYQFILSTKDGVAYYFNSGGQLILMEDANGKFVLFEHDAHKGVLSRMVTNNNIAIDFTYNDGTGGTDPLTVKEISMPDGSKVQYEYTKPFMSAEQLLTKVTEVSGTESIEYEYAYDKPLLSSQPRNLTVIKDAEHKYQYKINYDFETDQVKEAVYPNDEKFTFTYAPDNTCTLTKKYSGGQAVLGEKDFFNKITGHCEKSIRGVTDVEILEGTNEAGLDVTTYEYRDNLLISSTSTAQYYEVNTDGYVVKKSGFRENAAKYSGDDPVKETEEDGTVSDYTYYTEADGTHLDGLIKTVKETNASGKVSSDKLYTYDAAGNVTQVIDYAAGTKTVNTYYAEGAFKGELNTMTESTITVTGANQIDSETLKSTSVYAYAYNTAGGTITKTETCTQTIPKPDGTNEVITTSQKYDQMGRMLTDTDSRGYQTINAYDGFGRITGTTYKYSDSDQLKQQTSRSYDKNGMTIYEKLEDGIEKWYAYDNMGRITSIRVKKGDAADETINYTYRYEDINVYQGKGTDTVAVNHAYVTRQAYADGTIISETYEDHCGNKVRVYEGGLYTDMTYSSQGDMITKWQMGQTLSATEGLLEIYLYDEKGNLTETITDPDYVPGTSTTGFHVRPDSYDENDMLIQGSIVSKSRYDADGNAVEQTDPRGNTTQYAYDKDGNLLSVLLPDQAKYEYQYDIEGTGNTTMDVVLEPRAFGTDAARQMSKSIVVKDSTDKTIKVEDLGISDADGTSISTTYEYDIRDNLVKATEKNGNYKAYTYDSRNRVIAIDYYEMGNETAARTLRTEFSYDAADNLTAMADKEVQDGAESMYRYTAYGYDGFNRLVWVSECKTNAVPAETVIDANKVSYGYDSKDRLVSIDYANSSNGVTGLRFTYNIHGWLMKVNAVNGSNSEKLLRQYAYTDDGKVGVITDYTDFLNGTGKWLKRTYEYDKLNRPVSIAYTDNMSGSAAEVKESHTYAYDKNNNIISETKLNAYGTGNGANYQETYSYQYDANNRLSFSYFGHMPTQYEASSDVETTYSYDAAGNKTAETVFISGWSYPMEFENSFTYNEFNQLTASVQEDLDSYSNATYAYDQNGNQTSKTDTANGTQTLYIYDAANRLKTATGKTGGAVDYVQENKYNGFGQRVQKKEGNDVTNYFYDGSAVLYTTDGDDTATSFNLVGTEDNILSTARTEADGTTSFFVYTKDIRESTTNIIGKNGQAEVSYDYDIYGETTEHQKDSADPFYNEICYTAGIYDDTTGLYNLNARYYSPADQTFLTQDTYRGSRSKTATLNYYAYCAGNPVSYTDPSGHAFWGVVGAAMGAYDGYKYAKKKNLKGWKKVAAIGVGAALGAINPFKVVKAVKTVSKVYKASKYTKKAVSAKKTATAAKKVAAKPKQTVTTKKSTINTIRTNATKKQGQQVKRIQKRVDNPGCFVAGTKIHAKDGYKNIETIKAGDYVWSENPETKEKALKKVKKIFVREKDSTIRLAINGEAIETTDEHPFYVENVGFVAAKDLKVGDEVRLATGGTAEVEASETIALDEPIQVYNFEVEDFHTYYVSGQKVLVHNTCAVTTKNAAGSSQKTPLHLSGKSGEKKLAAQVGGEPQAYFPTSQGGRFVDQLANGTAHEAKTGYTPASRRIRAQVAKDAELIESEKVEGAYWHFYRSDVTGRAGPSGPLAKLLKSKNIDYTVEK